MAVQVPAVGRDGEQVPLLHECLNGRFPCSKAARTSTGAQRCLCYTRHQQLAALSPVHDTALRESCKVCRAVGATSGAIARLASLERVGRFVLCTAAQQPDPGASANRIRSMQPPGRWTPQQLHCQAQ
jgi:hypothetical protein